MKDEKPNGTARFIFCFTLVTAFSAWWKIPIDTTIIAYAILMCGYIIGGE